MTTRVAINGFGRIGRLVLRAIIESGRKDIEVVGINDLGPEETNAHLLRYDSVHGRFPGTVKVDGNTIDAGRGPHARHRHQGSRHPALEGTQGRHRARVHRHLHVEGEGLRPSQGRRQARARFGAGRRRRPDGRLWRQRRQADEGAPIVSNASCTTNCLVPVAKVLHDAVGVEKGMMTTIHSYTGDQPTLDTMHKDLYRARAAALSMIPTSTGAAKAIGLVLPELKGKLDGISVRVPTPNVSLVDLKFIGETRDERGRSEQRDQGGRESTGLRAS